MLSVETTSKKKSASTKSKKIRKDDAAEPPQPTGIPSVSSISSLPIPSTPLHVPSIIKTSQSPSLENSIHAGVVALTSLASENLRIASPSSLITQLRAVLKGDPQLKTVDLTLWWTLQAQQAIAELSSCSNTPISKVLQLVGIDKKLALFDEDVEEFSSS